MKKFKRSLRGYNTKEVNAFVNEVVSQVEIMVNQIKEKDLKIQALNANLLKYKNMEETLNKSIVMAQETSEQMRRMARIESENIISDAKKNANKIVNDALTRASKVEAETAVLKKNINIFKTRLKNIIEQQLQMVDDMDNIDI
ncbi:MAG: DivIVA domain-containing protein [Bacilli bacterium]|nr:DivIVA domain-containing protein [Bacilli bacterium]